MSSSAKQTQEPTSVLSASTLVVPTEYSVLKTAITSVLTPKGNSKTNTIVDEGSQRSLMTRKLARKVKIKSSSQEFLLLSGSTGLSNKPSVYEVVEFTLMDKKDKPIYIKAIVVDQVAKPLEDKHRERINSLPHLKKLDLAHPTIKNDIFNIELLIGADFYWSIVEDEKPIRGDGPVAVRSRIGYLVSGPLPGTAHESPNPVIPLHVTAIEELDVSCLWSLESLGIHPQKENSEEAAEYARENIKYQDGKYVAKFPWKKEHPDLPPNFKMVQNMTRAIVRRLTKDPALFQFFGKLIEDQLENQFIEKVPESETTKPCHYIPYHYVKKNSVTTPIRIVYNCSCRAQNGVSFNDCVQTGAILQNDQVGIMLRFRSHQIGLVADDPSDPESELIAYRFKVIPFGAKSSPFILNSTVIHHLKQESSAVARDMQNNIFVDNIVSGCKTQEEAIEYYSSANTIMKRAGLPLQAWGFSDPVVEEKIKKDGRLDQSSISKTLGFIWDRSNDRLSIQPVNMLSFCSVSATHKDILRGTHSLYDPLGFYSPLSVKGKILLQDLNREKVPLEQKLSDQQLDRWRIIAADISSAVDQRILSVSRPFFPFHLDRCELHIFSDASRRAYGAVAYLVQNNQVAFVMVKSKINPKKEESIEGERELSIPEAELMAAYIGTLVAETIVAALEPLGIRIQVFFWSDSQIVLFWISKPENHPRSFITNRVKKIQESTRLKAATWKYVTTDQNPADILSRGASLKEFKASDIWKNGPIWLTDRKT
ncbi:uncharacterized protein LOC123467802 [Daphnia magna]|uniref:uncharacterized protein LOC123467802 n=1 Tax=Daphnia magna TaxID=35525 RepID=UPI001E1BC3AC|nr:uncharacterized protein LOC123467802 [Daphnia magna]